VGAKWEHKINSNVPGPLIFERRARAGDLVSPHTGGVIGVGYEGRTLDELVTQLVAMDVSRLVDVRLNPISRKPGLSKTALGRALTAAGIAYEHRRELGNPKTNRSGFAGDDTEWKQARSRYQELLRQPEAIEALDAVAKAASEERVAVLCFEADEHRCHRDLVLAEARQRLTGAAATRHPAR
jgi:uncharacterized protein (DUF488 family)